MYYYLGGLTHLSPRPNPLERGLWGLGLYEEWARGQIDTSNHMKVSKFNQSTFSIKIKILDLM